MKNNIFLHPLLPSAWDAITVTVCCAAILLLEALFSAGGGFHVETVGYIPHYLNLAGKPLGAIIFDPVSTDLGNYQARELSYLVDLWDVRFLAWSAKLGAVHFYSFSQWFLMVLTVLVQQYGTRKLFPQLPGYFATLFSLAFVLLPCVSANMYFRSAKHGTAFLFTLIVYLTIYLFRKTCIKNAPGAFAGLAAALVLAPFFDRQALFFVSLYTVGTGLHLSAQKKFSLPVQPLAGAGIAGICACLFAALYNLFIAPALIQYWNGYTPSFAMQNMPLAFQSETILNGAEFLFANLGYLLNRGNGFAALSVGIIFAILIFSGAVASAQKTGKWLFPLIVLHTGGACLVCSIAMYAKHPAILETRTYYFLPMCALLFPFFVFLADSLRVFQWKINPVLILLALMTALHLFSYVDTYPVTAEDGVNRPLNLRLPAFREAVNDPAFDCRPSTMPAQMERTAEYLRRLRNGNQ